MDTLPFHVRACTNCVRAKAKCSSTSEGGFKCQRCFRMNKECVPSPPMRKRRTAQKLSIKKSSKLEAKLDGLVSLVKSAGIVPTITLDETVDASPNESIFTTNEDVSESTENPGTNEYFSPAHGIPSLPSNINGFFCGTVPDPQKKFYSHVREPGSVDAEAYLNEFRTRFVKHLPFIIISPTTRAAELRTYRPLLWLSIMTVASKNAEQQIVLSREMRSIFGKEAYVEGTRTMDLLLSVLVYIAWDRYYSFDRPILTSLIQLAIAIVYDLALDKAPSKDPSLTTAYDLKGLPRPTSLTRTPTVEDRRVLIACYLLSWSSSCMRKGNTLRWTEHADNCLQDLEKSPECSSDIFLVQLVKLRMITEKAYDAPWSRTGDKNPSLRPPAAYYLNALENQVHQFKSNIPSDLVDNKTILSELFLLETIIYKIGLSQVPDILALQQNRHLETLWLCLKSTKAWADLFLSYTPDQYVGFSVMMYVGIARSFITIYLLSTFQHPEWDLQLVRESVNVPSTLERIAYNFSQVKVVTGIDAGSSGDLDSFSKSGFKIGQYMALWHSITACSAVSIEPEAGHGPGGDNPLQIFDDEWLSQLFGPLSKDWI